MKTIKELEQELTKVLDTKEIKNKIADYMNVFKEIAQLDKTKDISDNTKNSLLNNLLFKTFESVNKNFDGKRNEIKAKFEEGVNFDPIDLKTDSLTTKVNKAFENHSLGLLNSNTFYSFKVENIPTKVGKIESQSLFVDLTGNQLTIGNYYTRNSNNNMIDYDMLTSYISENMKKQFNDKKFQEYSKYLLPVVQSEGYTSYSMNTRNKIYTDKVLPLFEETSSMISKAVKNFELNEINLLKKIYEAVKPSLSEAEVEVLNFNGNKLISSRDNKSKEGLDLDKMKIVIAALELNKIKIPYKVSDIKPEDVKRISVVTVLNSKKVNDFNGIVEEINTVIKNVEADKNKSYQDIYIKEQEVKHYLEGKSFKGVTLKKAMDEIESKLSLDSTDANSKKSLTKELERLQTIKVAKLFVDKIATKKEPEISK